MLPLTCIFMSGTVRRVPANRHQSHRPDRQLPRPSQRSVSGRDPRSGAESYQGTENRWRTIRYAISSNARTVRLCVIMLIAAIPADVFMLLHH